MTNNQQLLADPEIRRAFEEELLFGEATDTIVGLLGSIGIPRKELASRLDLSEGRISQILSGGENITLRTLASIGWALGARFELRPIPLRDRAGTPAEGDPPLPTWMDSLIAPGSNFPLPKVKFPYPVNDAPVRAPLQLIDGTPTAA